MITIANIDIGLIQTTKIKLAQCGAWGSGGVSYWGASGYAHCYAMRVRTLSSTPQYAGWPI